MINAWEALIYDCNSMDKFSLPEKLYILELASTLPNIFDLFIPKMTQPSLTPTYPLNTGHAWKLNFLEQASTLQFLFYLCIPN